jgi:hypothetical protein
MQVFTVVVVHGVGSGTGHFSFGGHVGVAMLEQSVSVLA